MNPVQSILDRIARFEQDVFPGKRESFEALGGGRSPKMLLVTCSDSRIDPAMVSQTDPGEVFVIRNAGNLVAPRSAAPSAEAATIEYGIEALNIPDIVACGHTQCGAMAALGQPGSADGLPSVKAWIETSTSNLDHRDKVGGSDDDLTKLVAANVCQQLDYLRAQPCVATGLEAGSLRLDGWVYDFERGDDHACDDGGIFSSL